MDNIFLEGLIQTGKSTFIRKVLKEHFGTCLDGVFGFTSQRLTDSAGQLLGFRLAPAAGDLSIVADPTEADSVFKYFTPSGARVNMEVFETVGVRYMEEALSSAKAGHAKLILLDEIGGHELASEVFRSKLYEVLDSEYPCVGVIKSPDNTRRMDSSLTELNAALHKKIFATSDRGEFERSLRAVLKSI